ncbi:hypothetical protein K7432_013470 [Basidiobolus ranarum]|uniref:Cyclin n=1 Tax=Basidiobolus ranarum TaxID=34480 RepID=A0ABR2WJ55_9FUNG
MKASQLMFTSAFSYRSSASTTSSSLLSWPYYPYMDRSFPHPPSFSLPCQYPVSKQSSYASEKNSFNHNTSFITSEEVVKLDINGLAQFCADMVCSIWHFNSGLLEIPADPAFQGFCCRVLSSTQVPIPVVLLALIYIQRFKGSSPSTKGADSSEGRLFVVSLMLANKYLDDNAYTNRTWSEVTGIPLQEINIMEKEFLTVLSFNLNVTNRELKGWSKSLKDHLNYQGALLRSAASTEGSAISSYNYNHGGDFYWSYWHPFMANINHSYPFFPSLSFCKYTFPFTHCPMPS